MTTAKQYDIAGLRLSLYIGDKKDDSIHLICNGYNQLDYRGKEALKNVALMVGDALEASTHAQVTSLESIHDNMSRFDIAATTRNVPAHVLFDAADYTLEKLLPRRISREKFQVGAISTLREHLRDADKHELNVFRTALRGNINQVFVDFKKNATEKPASNIARQLSDNLRDKLIHREILDYLLGDRVMAELLEPTEARKTHETVDTFVARTAAATDNNLKQKIDNFLLEQKIGVKAKNIRKYLAG